MIPTVRHVIFCTLLAALPCLSGTDVTAQTRLRLDNRGKEFYVAFLPTDGFDNYPVFSITVWCEKPTRGTITYMSTGQSFPVNIPRAYTPVRIVLDTFDLLMPDPFTTPVTSRSVRARFDDEVALYGMNTQRWSSDSFVGLPEDAIGTDNVVLSYPNTSSSSPIAGNRPDFPSQFAVLATQDRTTVNIALTTRVRGLTGTAPFSITLNAGEVYLAQAAGAVGEDLTGTTVKSDKPVVVYGSHQRTNIPFTQSDGRDHIVEQMWPTNLWGRRVYLTPDFQLPKTVQDANIARIIARFNNTEVTVDSVPLITLRAGEKVEIPVDRPKIVTASGPILAAQYHHSSVEDKYVRTENDTIGDPFMELVQPPEYFDTLYAFESYSSRDFFVHYINVVIPTERTQTLEMDNAPLNGSFIRIASTSYSYAQVQVQPGMHLIKAKVPFGLMIYGYGPYNSYGHPGGMVFDTLFKDQKPPDLLFADTCNGKTGLAIDDSLTDFGIERVRLEPSSLNIRLSVDTFKPGQDSVRFRLLLRDPFSDGRADLTVVDSAGLDHRYSVPVRGFTVSMSNPVPVLDTLASLNGQKFCRSVTLTNYGRYLQTITSLKATPNVPGLTITTPVPFTLAPGQARDVEYCYIHRGDTAAVVTLSIGDGCLDRALTLLPLLSGVDSLRPDVRLQADSCSGDRIFAIEELGALSAGIASVDFLSLVNATATLTPAELPSKQSRLLIKRTDPRQDMIYHIRVTDLVGNVVEASDTIAGFTLEAQLLSRQQVGLRVDRPFDYTPVIFGRKSCDSVYLYNYGMFPILLNANVRMLSNIQYSIPPEQFPLTIPPGGRYGLAVCVKPAGIGDRMDTLSIDYLCGTISELVQIRIHVDPLDGAGVDRCSTALLFSIGGFAKRNFIQPPSPNPAGGSELTNFTIGITHPQDVRLVLFDMLGRPVKTLWDLGPLQSGITRLSVRLDDIPQGLYHVRMTTADGTVLYQKLTVNR